MKKQVVSIGLSFAMACGAVIPNTISLFAKENVNAREADVLGGVKNVKPDSKNNNIVWVEFTNGMKGKLTFLDKDIFRYNVDPKGEFGEYAPVRSGYPDTAKIQQYPDSSDKYSHPAAKITQKGKGYEIHAGNVTVCFDDTAKMTIKAKDKVVMQEKEALSINGSTVQTLVKNNESNEQFFGGGTQNGRSIHTGNTINISNESGWNDGQVSSPNPFYYTTNGYGVLRNTYQSGSYDFGNKDNDTVRAAHSENEFDAYYFVSEKQNPKNVVQDLLNGYFKVTGNPALLPEYGYYLGHLNAYNRDAWSHDNIGTAWTVKGNESHKSAGTTTYERGGTGTELRAGETAETLNGYGPTYRNEKVPAGVKYSEEFSARGRLDLYKKYDMPMGFFLPNDGYGAGYGQNGFKVTGGVNEDGSSSEERLAAVAANVANLKDFADYAKEKGVATGLWTQSQLVPDSDPKTEWQLLRDFKNEVKAGVTTLKTDVAWVGPGYSFQLSGVKQAYDIVTTMKYDDGRNNTRPNIISLDGWAGSQRFNSVWTGDQTGGKWDYIRFHIPTFVGQGLSGNPNIGCDMDGIWGGSPVIATRDYQWKSFAPQMLDMDGWGKYMKGPYTHGDPYTGVSRMYLKMKAMMMPYIYTNAYAASNIDTGNGDKGLPTVRAMFLEYPYDPITYSDMVKYQYMWGENLLVAPVYQDTDQDEDKDNDVRDGIYLPDANQVWVDFFTGEQYRGGQVLNNFDAPLWKLPVFVKNGSILPMTAENNSAYEIDRTQRLIEFWPAGETDFTAIEDDGTYVKNDVDKSNEEYGVIDNVSYGPHVSTKYTSTVEGTTATLTANKSTGSYDGYNQKKDTTFIVHASKKPSGLEASNGNTKLNQVEVDSKKAFEETKPAKGEFVSFYDETPEIETFASEKEKEIAKMVEGVKVSGKLYVKFANTDSQANEQKLVIKGFENKASLNSNELNENLKAPTNLKELEDLKTPTSVTLAWDSVKEANGYEILVDGTIDEKGNITSGILNSVPAKSTKFTHTGLKYLTEHSYYVRSVNKDGHSAWTNEFKATSADDPFVNSPEPKKVSWTGDLYAGRKADLAFDKIFQEGDSGFHSGGKAIGEKLTVDYEFAHLFDYIEFYPREDAGNGTPIDLKVETSLDGVHWIEHGNTQNEKNGKYFHFDRNGEMKHIDLSDPYRKDSKKQYIGARYLRFTPIQTVGNFFSAREIKPYAIKGESEFGSKQKPFRVGNLLTQGTDKPSLQDFKSVYMKDSSAHLSDKNDTWIAEIRDNYCDINYNGMSDIWDYTFSGFNIDGSEIAGLGIKGSLSWVPSKTEIKKGETFTITLNAKDAVNISAFGGVLNYNPNKVEYVGVDYCDTEFLYRDGMTKPIKFSDGTAYINHGAMFLGNKYITSDKVVKSQDLSTITLKALDDIVLNDVTDVNNENFVIDLSQGIMIAPDHSFVLAGETKLPEEEKQLLGRNDVDITLTNEFLKEDKGENVNKLVQQGSYDALFNQTSGREWELKWDIDANHEQGTNKLPEYVALPLTMHVDLKAPKTVKNVAVNNAPTKGNGYLTSATAQVTYVDGTKSDVKKLSGEQEVFNFEFNTNKNVKSIDITFVSSTGTTVAGENNKMLTLSEIEIYTGKDAMAVNKDGLKASIEKQPAKDKDSYTSASWDAYQKALKAAKEVLANDKASQEDVDNAKAALDKAYEALEEKPVTPAVDKDGLKASIEKQPAKDKDSYTSASWDAYQKALKAAKEVLANDKASQEDVNNAKAALDKAYEALEEKPVTPAVDKDELNAAINKKPAKAESAYTKESWKVYQNALANANKVMDDKKATQEEVDAAKEQLMNAIKGLTLIESVNPKPENPEKPELPENPNTEDKPNDSVDGEKPNTGVSTNTALLWTIVLGAGAGALVTMKRRKKSN